MVTEPAAPAKLKYRAASLAGRPRLGQEWEQRAHPAMTHEPLLPPHGGYRNLKSFQVAQLVYDLTVRFCDR
ncbi:MAG TPA: hypothetical protein VHF69_13895 [Candidatus Synoicihabitans sp.]|nr:hypothetical protein [Candidatus Synoicihabitans sp.]